MGPSQEPIHEAIVREEARIARLGAELAEARAAHIARLIGQDAFDSALDGLLHRDALAKSYELRPNKAGRNQKQAVYRWAETASEGTES